MWTIKVGTGGFWSGYGGAKHAIEGLMQTADGIMMFVAERTLVVLAKSDYELVLDVLDEGECPSSCEYNPMFC